MKNTKETTGASPDDKRQPSQPKVAKPRFDPAMLPLVQLFRLVASLARRGDLNLCEALAVHAAARRLGVMAEFVGSGIKRGCHETDFDELYRAHEARCTLKGDQPLPRSKFEQLLLLDPLRPKPEQPESGEE
jgi:hypothetical protein